MTSVEQTLTIRSIIRICVQGNPFRFEARKSDGIVPSKMVYLCHSNPIVLSTRIWTLAIPLFFSQLDANVTSLLYMLEWPASLALSQHSPRKPVVLIRIQALKLQKNFGPRKYDKYSMCVNKENILGEYSLFFTPCLWNYLQVNWINLYRNDFVSTLSATIKPLYTMPMSPGHRLDLRPKSRDFWSL